MVRVKRNPLVETVRRALDGVAFAMMAHDLWANEYQHPDGHRGVEYVWGLGKEAVVVATWDHAPNDTAGMKWHSVPGLTSVQRGLVEAHSSIFANI